MSFVFSNRSKRALQGIHPDLMDVMRLALAYTTVDFVVLEGLRTRERQRELYDQGASKTMRSRHLTGHAVDIAPWINGEISWHWPHYHELAPYVFTAADACAVPIEWGGNWRNFPDGPHWQLPWEEYPT